MKNEIKERVEEELIRLKVVECDDSPSLPNVCEVREKLKNKPELLDRFNTELSEEFERTEKELCSSRQKFETKMKGMRKRFEVRILPMVEAHMNHVKNEMALYTTRCNVIIKTYVKV
jgi:hypothetical protein